MSKKHDQSTVFLSFTVWKYLYFRHTLANFAFLEHTYIETIVGIIQYKPLLISVSIIGSIHSFTFEIVLLQKLHLVLKITLSSDIKMK